MLLVALALTGAAAPPRQILAGPAFEAFAVATERRCPQRRFRSITPADLDFVQERFERQLSRPARRHLTAVNTAPAHCASRNGLSCSVGRTLDAYRSIRMLGAFASYACTHHKP